MNDPRVKYLTYVVTHADWIEYEVAEPFSEKTDEYIVKIEDGLARLYPQRNYSTVEEAKLAAQDFVSQWNFEIALGGRDGLFKFEYVCAHVIDHQPSPAPPGVHSVSADPAHFHYTIPASARVTLVRRIHLQLPIGRCFAVSDPNVVAMMEQWTDYHHGREHLGTMAYCCLTIVQDSLKSEQRRGEQRNPRKLAAQDYRISMSILDCIGKLSSKSGARKAEGIDKPFNEEETRFLEMAVRALIRRVAEHGKNPSADLLLINKANLELYATRGVTEPEGIAPA